MKLECPDFEGTATSATFGGLASTAAPAELFVAAISAGMQASVICIISYATSMLESSKKLVKPTGDFAVLQLSSTQQSISYQNLISCHFIEKLLPQD